MEMLRRRDMFGPNGDASPPPLNSSALMGDSANPSPAPTNAGDSRLAGVYGSLANTDTGPANKSYRDYLAKGVPQEEDFKPGKMGRLSAILAGASTGLSTRDGGLANKAAQDVLDDPYNKAMGRYKLEGDKLAKGADLEEKDINNRVKTYRDIVESQDRQANNDRLGKLNDAQIRNYNSQIDNRGSTGYSQYNTPVNGHRMATKIVNGKPMNIDLGAVDLSPDEKNTNAVDRAVKTAKATSPIIAGREKDVASTNRAGELDKEKQIADYRASIALSKEQRANLEKQARSAADPNRAFAARALALRDVIDKNPKAAGLIDLQALTHKPEIDAEVKAAEAKYAPVSGNTNTNTNTPTAKTEDAAKAYLKANNKPVTDANVKHLMSNQDKW